MNFFKSILSEDPDSPKSEKSRESDPNDALVSPHEYSLKNEIVEDETAFGWSFGGLMKTLSTRSESVIETYRKDLKEFGLGLQKETEIIREAASRAVKDLPASLEAGASAAHGALDGVLKSTADIISKETLGFMSDVESDTPGTNKSLKSARYSRFDAQLSSIQSDLNTFCEEPEDLREYQNWKLKFELNERTDEIDGLMGENGTLEGVYQRLVPNEVDSKTFWYRYFYRVDKLKQQERVRANLVKRAISVDDEEELSWDVEEDDDDDDDHDAGGGEGDSDGKMKERDKIRGKESSDANLTPSQKLGDSSDGSGNGRKISNLNMDNDYDDRNSVTEPSKNIIKEASLDNEKVMSGNIANVKSEGDAKNEQAHETKNDEKEEAAKKNDDKGEGGKENDVTSTHKSKVEEEAAKKNDDKGEGGKENDVSSTHKSKVEEEDLEWDEIEDIESGDEKKTSTITHGVSPKTADSRNVSTANIADDDEDLNWDLDDDDEPGKA